MIPLLFIILAQGPTTANLPPSGIALDILRPHFPGARTSLLSAALYASGRATIGATRLSVELPFFNLEANGSPASSTLGNPYLGLELGGHNGLSGTAGVRLPLVTSQADEKTIGSYVDVSRFEAFRPHTFSFQGTARYRMQNADSFFVAAIGGPTIWMATERTAKTELVLHHQLTAGYEGSGISFAVGVSGLSILTEKAADVGERTISELALSLGSTRGSVRPAFHFLVPLDEEYSSVTDFVIGFGVALCFPL